MVTCGDSHITGISLTNNNMMGSIPVGLGQLTGLTLLVLSSNGLHGTLPDDLTKLSNLNFLCVWFRLS